MLYILLVYMWIMYFRATNDKEWNYAIYKAIELMV